MSDDKKTMDGRIDYQRGFWVALVGAIIGLVFYPLIFLDQYILMMDAEMAKGGVDGAGCRDIVRWYYPFMTDIGIIAGMIFLMSAYGFYKKEEWAYTGSIVAIVMFLFSSFWPLVPAMDTGNFPYHVFIFAPALAIYVVLTAYIKKMPWSRITFGMLLGMAMITSFTNGIASTQRIMTLPDESVFKITQRLNWVAGVALTVVVVGILLKPKNIWVMRTAIIAIIVEFLAGLPVAADNMATTKEFSMFLLGPIFCFMVFLVILADKWDAYVQPDY
ncbi:MAG: hypothetical protein ACTSYA_10780 [Candidatus Kariarchaeaceae archaeon]